MLVAVKRWQVWSAPLATLALIFTTEIVSIAIPVATSSPVSTSAVWTAILLASLSIAYSIHIVSSEGAREALRGPRAASWNMLATWTFASAIILPMRLACAVIVITAIFEWPVKDFAGNAKLYRHIYSSAGVLLAAEAANALLTQPHSFAVLLPIAIAAYLVVNVIVVSAAMVSVGNLADLRVFLAPKVHAVELVTVSLGSILAIAWRAGIPLVWLSLPAAVAIQRVAMRSEIKQIEKRVVRPMSDKVWNAVAREVVRACTTASVLRVDTADPVAAAAVARLQAGCDAIGTVGRSGLAILLADCPGANADSLARRLRSALSTSGIGGNVAVAAKPRDGQSLDDLLAVSEAELITRDAATRSAKSPRPDAYN